VVEGTADKPVTDKQWGPLPWSWEPECVSSTIILSGTDQDQGREPLFCPAQLVSRCSHSTLWLPRPWQWPGFPVTNYLPLSLGIVQYSPEITIINKK
jgi:hypothetical protein